MAINKNAFLKKNLFSEKASIAPTRNGFGEGLLAAGKKNKNIVALCADLCGSTRVKPFAEAFPERFFQVGVAEQNMAAVASGMAAEGKIPFAASFAMFSPGRNWEQIRTTICYNDQNVKIIGSHAGISTGPDGATHQALEDIAILRAIPNMEIIVPADAEQAKNATLAMAKSPVPGYLRLSREKTPEFTSARTPFAIGKADVYWSGKDVTVIACGLPVHDALVAAKTLGRKASVEVINCHTVKPLDAATILKSVRKTGRVVTVEEHQLAGGMGSAVSELLARELPAPVEMLGIDDKFGESGSKAELWEQFGLGPDAVINAVLRVMKRKKAKS
ncbi:MAG: transketolase C-terminal domain-containing protein [Candidatus Kerfeldbacteria bacterium]